MTNNHANRYQLHTKLSAFRSLIKVNAPVHKTRSVFQKMYSYRTNPQTYPLNTAIALKKISQEHVLKAIIINI